MTIRSLVRIALARFLPTAAILLGGPIVIVWGADAIGPLGWTLIGLEVVAMTATFLSALLPVRRRLRPETASSFEWQLGSAATAVVATGALTFLARIFGWVSFGGLIAASVSGGLIAAVPLLVTSWRSDEDREGAPDL